MLNTQIVYASKVFKSEHIQANHIVFRKLSGYVVKAMRLCLMKHIKTQNMAEISSRRTLRSRVSKGIGLRPAAGRLLLVLFLT